MRSIFMRPSSRPLKHTGSIKDTARSFGVLTLARLCTKRLELSKGAAMARISLKVNGKNRTVEAPSEMPLLYVLRDDFQLNGPKFGCGLGQCGACTVIIDRKAVRSCVTPVSTVGAKPVT